MYHTYLSLSIYIYIYHIHIYIYIYMYIRIYICEAGNVAANLPTKSRLPRSSRGWVSGVSLYSEESHPYLRYSFWPGEGPKWWKFLVSKVAEVWRGMETVVVLVLVAVVPAPLLAQGAALVLKFASGPRRRCTWSLWALHYAVSWCIGSSHDVDKWCTLRLWSGTYIRTSKRRRTAGSESHASSHER